MKKKWLIALVAALTAAVTVVAPPLGPLVPVLAEVIVGPAEPQPAEAPAPVDVSTALGKSVS